MTRPRLPLNGGTPNPVTLERARQLARSGEVRGIMELERRLRTERCVDVSGSLKRIDLRRNLAALCRDAFQGRLG